MRILWLLTLAACDDTPAPPPAAPRAPLPAFGSARIDHGVVGAPIAPIPGAAVCDALGGAWTGELTACYSEAGQLVGVELDVSPDDVGEAVRVVRDTYAPADELVAVGGSAWEAEGVRLEVVREVERVHVRAWRA